MTPAHDAPARLAQHLRTWLGAWPPPHRVTVVGTTARTRPGWDGRVQRLIGVGAPQGTVLSVPPAAAAEVRALGDDLAAPGYGAALARVLGQPDRTLGRSAFRWSTAPAALDDAGIWVPRHDPRVPEWLLPFNGEVLIALDGDGDYAAGVGLKRHDAAGWEIAVVTVRRARGRGLARRLVAQAARAALAAGAVPTYLHLTSNTASARAAEAAGFPDRGWSVYGLWSAPRLPPISAGRS